MKTLTVKTKTPYQIFIGKGLLKKCGVLLREVLDAPKIAMFTDDIVDELYGEVAYNSLKRAGYDVEVFVMPHGEENKSMNVYFDALNFMAENKFDRSDAVVALGGGVVGDMAGFVAATYLRGVRYAQLPTTIVAQTDSSIGGKTGIDLPNGKNLVGAFYQPVRVIADTDTLKTLPKDEAQNGLGELVKYACLIGGEAMDIMEKGWNSDEERLIELCVDFKRNVVEKDEREQGVRRLLNLGHTVAHAVELLSGYTIPHGKAVAIGLNRIAYVSYKHFRLTKPEYQRIIDLLKKYKLRYELPFAVGDIAACAGLDKKAEGASLNLVIIDTIGSCAVKKIPLDELEDYLL